MLFIFIKRFLYYLAKLAKLVQYVCSTKKFEAVKLIFFYPSHFSGLHIPYPNNINKNEIRDQLFDQFVVNLYTKHYHYTNADVIFDLGGSYGITSLWFHHLFPQSKIYVFEPNPHACKYIREIFAMNNIEQVTLYQVATYDDDNNNAELYIHDDGFGNANTFQPYHQNSKKITVKVDKVSRIVLYQNIKKIDLLKMNIEGGEYAVLHDLEDNRLLGRVQYIAFELHIFLAKQNKAEKLEEALSLLRRNSFRIYYRPFGSDAFQIRYFVYAWKE